MVPCSCLSLLSLGRNPRPSSITFVCGSSFTRDPRTLGQGYNQGYKRRTRDRRRVASLSHEVVHADEGTQQ